MEGSVSWTSLSILKTGKFIQHLAFSQLCLMFTLLCPFSACNQTICCNRQLAALIFLLYFLISEAKCALPDISSCFLKSLWCPRSFSEAAVLPGQPMPQPDCGQRNTELVTGLDSSASTRLISASVPAVPVVELLTGLPQSITRCSD